MTKDEALQMCLEYIETDAHERKYVRHAIKQALAAPVPWSQALESVWAEPDDTTPPAQPAPVQESVALREALAEALTSVYVCGRVWEAWNYGTMSEGDFQPAAECDEVLDALVEAATKATPPAAQRQWVGLTDEEIENCYGGDIDDFAQAIEAKLKEKNT
jgi:hypothetical protein